MENNEFFREQLIVYLTIEGTPYTEVEVEITDTNKTVRDEIDTIMQVYGLPKMDNGGNPVEYKLGKINENGEPEVMELEDEEGFEKVIGDYSIQKGDHLQIVSVVVAG